MLSILKHREWNWKDILEMLENDFWKRVECYSQPVDNIVEIKSPFARDKGIRSIDDLVAS